MLFIISFAIVSYSSTVLAGYLPYGPVSVGGPCATSAQCAGPAVCGFNLVCECPAPLYRAIGGACQVVTVNTLSYVPSVRTTVIRAYPGYPCGAYHACVGGSFCSAGVCGCPVGYAVAAASCVAAPAPLPAAFRIPVPAAFRYAVAPVAPVPVPVPALVPRFPAVVGYGCAGGCFGGQVCLNNMCGCPTGLVLTAGFCAPVAVPVVQVRPGGFCALGQECTGGSVCTGGVCCCPPELVQIGDSCVLRPPPPPAVVPVVQTFVQAAVVGVGYPCGVSTRCVTGAVCTVGVCQCGFGYYASGTGCVFRRR